MEEKKDKFGIEAENIKNETVKTAKKVKETIKNTKIKEETKNTKSFIEEMFKNPLDKIKDVANDNSNNFFRTAIVLIIIWTIIVFISSTYSTIYYWGFSRVFKNILTVLKRILAPALGILVYSVIMLVLNKENKKSLTNIISTVTITQIPLIISALISLLTIISSNITTITIPFSKVCSVISIVLGYFGFKFLFEEENDKSFITKFALIQAIYYVVYIIMGLLGIYI